MALDTEFIREKSYFPRLCLLQVGNGELVACIDPLALPDLDELLALLYDPAVVKVFHAGRQDLEIFYHLRGELPQPLFDTQIAAALLGYGDQVGYGALVKEMLGIELAKAHSRTDWSQRPLDADQLRYAADDVRYLGDLYREQQRMLTRLGRMDWLASDFASLADPATYRNDARDAWRRVRGIQHLRGRQLAVLQVLAAWREEQARMLDRPRKWILRDEVLLELARRQPLDQHALARIRGLEAAARRHYGSELLDSIRHARESSPEQWPRPSRRPRLSLEQEAAVDAMMALVRLIAADNRISPASLTSRKELEQLVCGEQECMVLRGWRGALCGRRLQRFLKGGTGLQMVGGNLVESTP